MALSVKKKGNQIEKIQQFHQVLEQAEAFIPIGHWKSIGHIGAGTFTSTATWMHRGRYMTGFMS